MNKPHNADKLQPERIFTAAEASRASFDANHLRGRQDTTPSARSEEFARRWKLCAKIIAEASARGETAAELDVRKPEATTTPEEDQELKELRSQLQWLGYEAQPIEDAPAFTRISWAHVPPPPAGSADKHEEWRRAHAAIAAATSGATGAQLAEKARAFEWFIATGHWPEEAPGLPGIIIPNMRKE